MKTAYMHTHLGQPVNYLAIFQSFSLVGRGEVGGPIAKLVPTLAQLRREQRRAFKTMHPNFQPNYGYVRVHIP